MTNRFMITVAAAALIAGAGFANAQGSREGGAGGAGMQQSAPSSPSGGAASHEGSSGMKSTQSEEKGGARNAQQEMKSEKGAVGQKSAGEKSAQESREKPNSMSQNEKGAAGKEMKGEERERNANTKSEGRDRNMKAEERDHDRTGNKAEERERSGNMKAEGRDNAAGAKGNTAAGAREEGRSQTVGQAGAGAKLSTEQRTRITSVIRDQHVAPVNNVNFAISVGTRVPREIGFHPLPAEIVTIYPEWRGYEFFLVRDEIVVVDPRTLEIVAVLEA